jgi:putative FmdB family regulatory protein
MPFYEYQCGACGAHHEAMQKISDPPLKKCPECGRPRLRKLISAPVFRLKGGGWYETDFKSDQEKKRNLAGDDKPEKSDGDARTDAKTETKADAKAEPKGDAKAAGAGDAKSASKPAKAVPASRKKPAATKRSAVKKKPGRR